MTDTEFFDILIEFINPKNEEYFTQPLWIETFKNILKENKELKCRLNYKIEQLKEDMLEENNYDIFMKKKYCYDTLKEILNIKENKYDN